MRIGLSSLTFWDRVFDARINNCIVSAQAGYEKMMYRDVMKWAFFSLQQARDQYRHALALLGEQPHAGLMERFVRVQTVLMAPIIPHWSDHIWRNELGHANSVFTTRFPWAGPVDQDVLQANDFLLSTLHKTRSQIDRMKRDAPKTVTLYLTTEMPAWMAWARDRLQDNYSPVRSWCDCDERW